MDAEHKKVGIPVKVVRGFGGPMGTSPADVDLPEHRPTRVPTDLDEPTTEDIRTPYSPPYDDGS